MAKIVSYYGRELGINPDYHTQEVSKAVYAADSYVYGGTPLVNVKLNGDTESHFASYAYLQSVGQAVNRAPWALARFNKNAYIDDTYNKELGAGGGGKGVGYIHGVMTLTAGETTDSNGALVRMFGFVTTDSFVVGDPLFVCLDTDSLGAPVANFGKITKTKTTSVNDKTFVGWVSDYWADATHPCLEVEFAKIPVTL